MNKKEIELMFLPKLKNKTSFFKLAKSNFYKNLKEESLFQFFVVQILREHNYKVIVNEKSGNKSYFEQYLYKSVGNMAGVPDLFVWKGKGVYLELKKSESIIYKKNGDFKKFSPTIRNQFNFIKEAKAEGYNALFLYPENFEDVFKYVFKIE